MASVNKKKIRKDNASGLMLVGATLLFSIMFGIFFANDMFTGKNAIWGIVIYQVFSYMFLDGTITYHCRKLSGSNLPILLCGIPVVQSIFLTGSTKTKFYFTVHVIGFLGIFLAPVILSTGIGEIVLPKTYDDFELANYIGMSAVISALVWRLGYGALYVDSYRSISGWLDENTHRSGEDYYRPNRNWFQKLWGLAACITLFLPMIDLFGKINLMIECQRASSLHHALTVSARAKKDLC